jgi:hypothetical protein
VLKKIGKGFNHPNFWFVFAIMQIYLTVQATISNHSGWYITACVINVILAVYNMAMREK